jgi:hypothetical protein
MMTSDELVVVTMVAQCGRLGKLLPWSRPVQIGRAAEVVYTCRQPDHLPELAHGKRELLLS